MADRHRRRPDIEWEYPFDRLLATKLEQVYALLVPDRARRAGESAGVKGEPYEDSCH